MGCGGDLVNGKKIDCKKRLIMLFNFRELWNIWRKMGKIYKNLDSFLKYLIRKGVKDIRKEGMVTDYLEEKF